MSTQAHSPTVGGGDRLVAGISLACLPAAVAIVAVGAINNVEGVLLALAGIALVIAGGWYAVCRCVVRLHSAAGWKSPSRSTKWRSRGAARSCSAPCSSVTLRDMCQSTP